MNKDNIVLKNLLEEAIENYKVCIRLLRMPPDINSRVSISYVPFLSVTLLDIIDKLDCKFKVDHYYSQPNYTFTQLLQEHRLILKQGTEQRSYKKICNEIKKSLEMNYLYLTKDYNIIQKMCISLFGQKDFSVYTYKNLPYMNNIQNNKMHKLFLDKRGNVSSADIKTFAGSASNFLQLFISQFINVGILEKEVENSGVQESDFAMKDYFVCEQNRAKFFKNNLEDSHNIYLFNLLCLVNSSNYVYPEVLGLGGQALKRIRIMTYLIMIKGLWQYQKEFHDISLDLQRLLDEYNQLFEKKEDRQAFRNHLFHFDIPREAIYERDLISTLINHYIRVEEEVFNTILANAFEVFSIELQKILF